MFDFTKGKAAKALKDKFNIDVERANYLIESSESVEIEYSKTENLNGYRIYTKGEDQFLMFSYKKESQIKKYGLPKYHTQICSTRESYSGYISSSSLPVDVKCSNTGKEYPDSYLKYCKNCQNQVFSRWSAYRNKKWYDILLKFVEDNQNDLPYSKSTGYLKIWKHVSFAFREKKKYQCSNCKVILSEKSRQQYLHVHHIDHNKKNNETENFQCLCVLCHSLEHEHTIKDAKWIDMINAYLNILDTDEKRKMYIQKTKWEEKVKAYYLRFVKI